MPKQVTYKEKGSIKKKILDKLNKINLKDNEHIITVFEILFGFFCGYILSSVRIYSMILPIGLILIAITTTKSKFLGLFSVVGVITGYIIGFNTIGIYYAFAAFGLYLISLVFSKETNNEYIKFVSHNKGILVLTLITAITLIFNLNILERNIINVTLTLINCGIIFGSYKILVEVANEIESSENIASIIKNSSKHMEIFALIILTGLYTVRIGDFNFGATVASFSLLMLAQKSSPIKNVMIALTLSLCGAIVNIEYAYLISAMGVGAILLIVTKSFGPIISTISYILSSSIMCFVSRATFASYMPVIQILLAGAVFILLPQNIKKITPREIVNPLSKNNEELFTEKGVKIASARFESMGNVFSSIAKGVGELTKDKATDDISSVFIKATDKVCMNCGLQNFCWEKNYNDTMDTLNNLTTKIKSYGKLTYNEIPEYFKNRCTHISDLLENINYNYNHYMISIGAKNKLIKERNILSYQYENMAQMFYESAKECRDAVKFDIPSENRAKRYFKSAGFTPSNISVYTDIDGRCLCEVDTGFVVNINKEMECVIEKCKDIFETATGLDLCCMSSVINCEGDSGYIKFAEKEKFVIEYSAAQLAKSGESVCGDSIMIMKTERGKQFIALSDGMGSGKSANEISKNALAVLKGLVRAGTNEKTAMNMLNSSLLIKGTDENFATLDGVTIDLYSGMATFMKAGAATSYILRDKKLYEYSVSSVPCGLVEGAEYDVAKCNLRDGDLIFIFSDGITDFSEKLLKAYIQNLDYHSLEDAAKGIIKFAHSQNKGYDDDMSVIICKVIDNDN